MPPADFVPLAEGTGPILPLTLRTLDVAVVQARSWLDDGRDVQIAVNLSPRCLLDPDFAGAVRGLLERHGLPARLLRLEITETAVVVDPARAMLALAEPRACGVALSIDDFGTGTPRCRVQPAAAGVSTHGVSADGVVADR